MLYDDGDYPKQEMMADLVRDKQYVEIINWRLFEDLDAPASGTKNVLVILGDRWTLLRDVDFVAVASRIISQL